MLQREMLISLTQVNLLTRSQYIPHVGLDFAKILVL